MVTGGKACRFVNWISCEIPASIAASSPAYTLRHSVDEIVSETGDRFTYCQCTPMQITLLRLDASVYPAGPLNPRAA